MDESQLNYFKVMSHYDSPDDFLEKVRNAKAISEENCKDLLLRAKEAFGAFKMQKTNAHYVLVSNKTDEVHEVTRGFGKGQEPKDYLDSFSRYLEEKYEKALEAASEMLSEKGISVTELELKMLIEAAVGEFNDVFYKWTSTEDASTIGFETEHEEQQS